MLMCGQVMCRHCFKNTEMNDVLVCSIEPMLIQAPDLKNFMLKCNSYKYRMPGEHLQPLLPIQSNGLYPGQIKPPKDYSDIDPDDEDLVVGEMWAGVPNPDDGCDT